MLNVSDYRREPLRRRNGNSDDPERQTSRTRLSVHREPWKENFHARARHQTDGPGVVLIGIDGQILFLGRVPKAIADLLKTSENAFNCNEAQHRLLEKLHRLQDDLIQPKSGETSDGLPIEKRFYFTTSSTRVLCRGQLLKGMDNEILVMVLIETLTPTPLTPREQSVLQGIRKGFTNKEIALSLKIGVHTTKDHVKRIMKKMKVHTRSGIVGKCLGSSGEWTVASG